jgi:hypothetical protein
MKCGIVLGSVAIIHIPGFFKIGSEIQKLVREGTQSHRQQGEGRIR